jgi:gluconate kinase
MQPQMLESQFRTLERPTADETDVITLTITEPVSQLVDEAIAALPVCPGSPANIQI